MLSAHIKPQPSLRAAPVLFFWEQSYLPWLLIWLFSNNGYKLPKIIWQPGSMQALSAPQLPICHTKTHARICSHLLYAPHPHPPYLIKIHIHKRWLLSWARWQLPHPFPPCPHKLPGGGSTVTGTVALHSPGPWAGVQTMCGCVCVHAHGCTIVSVHAF